MVDTYIGARRQVGDARQSHAAIGEAGCLYVRRPPAPGKQREIQIPVGVFSDTLLPRPNELGQVKGVEIF